MVAQLGLKTRASSITSKSYRKVDEQDLMAYEGRFLAYVVPG